jgi:regulator of sigma E protease
MNGLIMAAQLLLGLSILVILHELGHFLAARAFNIKVEKFYLFFDAGDVKLFSITRGDCEYGIGWLPLGGCKDRWYDRRVYGYRADGTTDPTLGIPV